MRKTLEELLALEDSIASFELKIKVNELAIEELESKLSKNDLASENLECDTCYNFHSYKLISSLRVLFFVMKMYVQILIRGIALYSFIHSNYFANGCQISSNSSPITKVYLLADSYGRGIA